MAGIFGAVKDESGLAGTVGLHGENIPFPVARGCEDDPGPIGGPGRRRATSHESGLVRTVGVHGVNLLVPVAKGFECDTSAVGRPDWVQVLHRLAAGESDLIGAVGVHGVDSLSAVVAFGMKDDEGPIWGPGMERVLARVVVIEQSADHLASRIQSGANITGGRFWYGLPSGLGCLNEGSPSA